MENPNVQNTVGSQRETVDLQAVYSPVGKKAQSHAAADVLEQSAVPPAPARSSTPLDPLAQPALTPTNGGAFQAPVNVGDSPLLPSPGLAYFVALILNQANKLYSELELADNEVEQKQLNYYDSQAEIYANQEKSFWDAQRTQAIGTTIGEAAMGVVSVGTLAWAGYTTGGIKGLLTCGLYEGGGGDLGEMASLEADRNFLQAQGGKSVTLKDPAVNDDQIEIRVSQSANGELAAEPAEQDDGSNEKIAEVEKKKDRLKNDLVDAEEARSKASTKLREIDKRIEESKRNRNEPSDDLKTQRKQAAKDLDNANTKFEEADYQRKEELDNVKKKIEGIQERMHRRANTTQGISNVAQSINNATTSGTQIYSYTVQGQASAQRAIADKNRTDANFGLTAAQSLFQGASSTLNGYFSNANSLLSQIFQAQRA